LRATQELRPDIVQVVRAEGRLTAVDEKTLAS
jgi:hypothetical protein